MNVSVKSGTVSSNKKPRRGLKKAVWNVLDKGLAPSSFGIAEIKRGLNSVGWLYGVHYNTSGLVHAINDLIVNPGCVAWKRNVRRDADKVWSYTPAQASAEVAPSHEMIDRMVDELAEKIIPIVRQRVKEKFGI